MIRQQYQWLQRFLAHLLQANPIQRSAFLMLLITIITLQYISWALLMFYWPTATQYIRTDVIAQHIPVGIGLLLGCLCLYLFCRYHSKNPSRPLQITLQTIVAIYYSVDMHFFGYLIGSMSMAAGAVILGSPIFGLFLLEGRAIYTALVFGLLLLLLLGSLYSLNLLTYAPLLISNSTDTASFFWFGSMMFFIMPYWIVVCLLCDIMIKNFRKREAEMRYFAEHDQLTSLNNRHSIDQYAKDIFEKNQKSCVIILLDLDHFKQINDQFGHPTGDLVLRHTAELLLNTVRLDDIVGRFGGEEFIILMTDTSLNVAMHIAERIRLSIAALSLQHTDGTPIIVQASLGLASSEKNPSLSFEQLIHEADIALYQAKRNGRNQVQAYHS
jgi:diguanylate cyclase (GGDEF)-like protein